MKKKAMVFALFGGVAVISLLIAFGIFRMRSDKDESTMESIAETNLLPVRLVLPVKQVRTVLLLQWRYRKQQAPAPCADKKYR